MIFQSSFSFACSTQSIASKADSWNVYFWVPGEFSRVGTVDAPHNPAAMIEAFRKWPEYRGKMFARPVGADPYADFWAERIDADENCS